MSFRQAVSDFFSSLIARWPVTIGYILLLAVGFYGLCFTAQNVHH